MKQQNTSDLVNELEWLTALINKRLNTYFNGEQLSSDELFAQVPAPELKDSTSIYAGFVKENKLSVPERTLLILTLVPYLKPELLDVLLTKNTLYDKRFSEFGGATVPGPGLSPTGETFLFILGGTSLEDRFKHYPLLGRESFLVRSHILKTETLNRYESLLNGRLLLEDDYREYFVTGYFVNPAFSEHFPAKPIATSMEWEDVVLKPSTMESVLEIKDWVEYGSKVMNSKGLGKRLRPGYKSLFYGPPGTGKTLTAALIGKSTGHEVYKVDLSMIVSKYIGETEKNLAKVFDQAQNKNWILFFDEADALFGKRTDVSSSHDRFANQEVAYLLQRIEDHPGVVILASNLKENIDTAFMRRFQSVIHFPMPGVNERYEIWRQAFSEQIRPAVEIDLRKIAEKYEIAGGLMMNVIRYCTLKAVKNDLEIIPLEDLETGIRRELLKEGILLA